jgi:hypothetical protein
MTRLSILFSAIVFLGLASQHANANCSCVCASGQPKAVCQSTTDVPPICMARTCPPVPQYFPTTPEASATPPLLQSNCPKQQIIDAITHEYKWKAVCR